MSDFDFNNVSIPEVSSYLQPGFYNLSVIDVKFEKPEGKTPYVKITFGNKFGQVPENFYITPKALVRLQYLHEAFIGKKLDKAFDGVDGVGAYFTKLFSNDKARQIVKLMTVGGKESNKGLIFPNLPYSNYVIEDTMNVQEGPFEKGDYNYTQYVRKAEVNASSNTESVMIPDSPGNSNNIAEDFDSLPF